MRGIIEAGIILFVIYLFLQWEKNGGATGTTTANPLQTLFSENPGSPSEGSVNEGAPSSNPPVAKTGGGCGCGGLS